MATGVMEFVDIVGMIAVIVTVGLNSAGLVTCRKIIQDGGVGAIPHLPFVAGYLMCSLWLCYGYLRGDSSLIVVNLIGMVLQFSYTVVFFRYVESKTEVGRDAAIATTLICGVVVYFILVAENHTFNQTILGIICNIFTVLFFSSPLASMSVVFKTKSTESMSLPLSFMSALTSGSWLLYGILIADMVVMFPNGIGLILSLVQLYLFVLYPSSPSTSSSSSLPL